MYNKMEWRVVQGGYNDVREIVQEGNCQGFGLYWHNPGNVPPPSKPEDYISVKLTRPTE